MENGIHKFHLDRSKVRILLCDSDAKSSQEVVNLLFSCDYQVTSVETARQVIDVLGANGPDIDIILAEIDLPAAQGFKMLKYINKKELRHIPIIMMSSQDEVSVVFKCLRLGAADYLVKPLRRNELLNLWTHMWRRRRMQGMAEKTIICHDYEMAASEPSDIHTNSTFAFSDDTDVRPSEGLQQDLNCPEHQKNEASSSPLDLAQNSSSEKGPTDIIGLNNDHAETFSYPKKTNLQIGETSAFLTYMKPNTPTNNYPTQVYSGESLCNTSNFPVPVNFPSNNMPCEGQNSNSSAIQPLFPFPFMMHQMFQGGCRNDAQAHIQPTMILNYNHLLQFPYLPSVPYFPNHHHHQLVTMALHSTQIPPAGQTSTHEVKFSQAERRLAALNKFRQKRKDRCFDKKIRYINRKKLAENRPRVRGQFVKQENGKDVDLNDSSMMDCDSEEDELAISCYPDNDASDN